VDVTSKIERDGGEFFNTIFAHEETMANNIITCALGHQNTIFGIFSPSSMDGKTPEIGTVDTGVGDVECSRGGDETNHVEMERIGSHDVGLSDSVKLKSGESTTNGGTSCNSHNSSKTSEVSVFTRISRGLFSFARDRSRVGGFG